MVENCSRQAPIAKPCYLYLSRYLQLPHGRVVNWCMPREAPIIDLAYQVWKNLKSSSTFWELDGRK